MGRFTPSCPQQSPRGRVQGELWWPRPGRRLLKNQAQFLGHQSLWGSARAGGTGAQQKGPGTGEDLYAGKRSQGTAT